MKKDSEIIRTEIMRILNENGRISGTELVKRVIEKAGNEEIVYREISALVEAGEIEKIVRSRSHIEYELIDYSESVDSQLEKIHKEIDLVFVEVSKLSLISKEAGYSIHERLSAVNYCIHAIQSTEGIMRLFSFHHAFKKNKMYSQNNRKIDDCWEIIMDIIVHQPEVHFLSKVLTNLRTAQFDSRSVN